MRPLLLCTLLTAESSVVCEGPLLVAARTISGSGWLVRLSADPGRPPLPSSVGIPLKAGRTVTDLRLITSGGVESGPVVLHEW